MVSLVSGLAVAVAAGIALAFSGRSFLNYDTAYAVLWGRDLADGRSPDLDLPLAPTPKPLAEAAGMLLGAGAFEVLSFVFLGVATALVFALGREWFAWPVGLAAALLFITREPVLSFGVRAYLDVPYVALVLAALLIETRRPKAGWPVLALLAVAGLLRPEAWLFSFAYVVWVGRWPLLALAAAAPLLWVLHDLLITGDPLFSLTGTQENAELLERKSGPVDLVLYGPRRLGEVLREPVLVAAAGGGLLALAWLRRRSILPAAAGAAAIAAFAIAAIAGLPIITRYLLLPGALLCVFAGVALFGWLVLARDDPRRRPWMAFAALCALLLVVFAPAQARRLDRLEQSIAIQHDVLADLAALPASALRCEPVGVVNRRPVPHLALEFGLDPARVRLGPGRTYVTPASQRVAERFVFDVRDRDRALPPPPRGMPRVAGNASWSVYSYSMMSGGGCS